MRAASWALIVCVAATGCGSSGDESAFTGAGGAAGVAGAAGDAGAGGDGGGGGAAGAAGDDGGAGAGGAAGEGDAGGAGGGGGGGPALDPTKDGPYAYAELDDATQVPASGDAVPIHCAYPTSGPTPGPYPVVVVAHGFQLPASQYYGYVKRLASFGYVALTADFPASLFSVNNVKNAQDLSGALDWAIAKSQAAGPLQGKVDATKAGVTGHSLGGKLSVLAASMDPRFGATITLDPVDSSMNCNPQDCPDASSKLPLPIPTGFLGEVTDASAGFQPCAPAADNYTTFYAAAAAPSLEVTVNGANHMSFLDDPSTCGVVCSFCQPATAPHDAVIGLAHAYVVAFYERWLRGNVAYDDWLTGPSAQAAFAQSGLATIASK